MLLQLPLVVVVLSRGVRRKSVRAIATYAATAVLRAHGSSDNNGLPPPELQATITRRRSSHLLRLRLRLRLRCPINF